MRFQWRVTAAPQRCAFCVEQRLRLSSQSQMIRNSRRSWHPKLDSFVPSAGDFTTEVGKCDASIAPLPQCLDVSSFR
jgi:hypothetical protein